jgi:hypothetical protein
MDPTRPVGMRFVIRFSCGQRVMHREMIGASPHRRVIASTGRFLLTPLE